MRSLLKISLAVLAVGFLALAGSAFAQDMAKPTMTITGDIGASFGQFSADKQAEAPATGSQPASQKAFSEFATSYESNLRFTWATDQFTVIGRLRVRGNNEGSAGSVGTVSGGSDLGAGSAISAPGSNANDFYTEAWWTPGAFKLGVGKFQGQAWANPFAGAYVILSPIEALTTAPNEYWMNWTGISGLDAEFNAGAVQFGVALSSQCRPSCNLGSPNTPNSAANGTSFSGTQSIVPHIAGNFGMISFRAQFPQTQGLIAASPTVAAACSVTPPVPPSTTTGTKCGSPTNTFGGATTVDVGETKTATGSGYQAGIGLNLAGGLVIGADLSSFTDTKIADLGELKDRSRSSYQVKVDVPAGPGIFTVAYFSIDDTNSAVFNATLKGDGYGAYSNPLATNPATNTYTSTKTTIRYTIPVSFGTVIPEYVTGTEGGGIAANLANGETKDKDLNVNLIRVILRAAF